jgi:membrane protease YdiL (CAAX protease family)
MAYLTAYLRLWSGSVWPSVLLHGAWNSIIQGTFDRATVGTPFAVGESGWLTAILSIIVVIVLIPRKPWMMQRKPGEPMTMASRRQASAITV